MPRTRTERTTRRVIVGFLASLVFAAPFAAGLATAQPSCVDEAGGNWVTLKAPRFPSGSPSLAGYAVNPTLPNRLFATNGSVVMGSTDGGCSWKTAYDPATDGGPAVVATEQRIEAIVIPETGPERAYLMIEEKAGPVVRPRVMRSDDAGRSWAPAETGLPPTGEPTFLRVAPSQPDTLYLGVGVGGVSELLFGSDDGGRTFTLRNNFARRMEGGINDLKVDPRAAGDLWVGASDGLFHSTDGGRSFMAIDAFAGVPTGPVDVFHGAGPASILAFKRGTGSGSVSDDGGETWLEIDSPGTPSSIDHGLVPQSRLISSKGKVWLYAPTLFTWVDAQAPLSDVVGITADRTANPRFYGFTASSIAIYSGPTGVRVQIPPEIEIRPDPSLLPTGRPAPPPRPAELSPDDRVVKIDAGETKTVPYDLLVPKTKTPLDVYFLIDTSDSQQKFIAGLGGALEAIVNGLIRSGTDVRFGLAEYRNYPDSEPPRVGPLGPEPNFIYQQRVDLGYDTTTLQTAIEDIDADGGGYYNAQLAALFHAASPQGEDVDPVGPAGNDVPVSTHAEFRKNALRVALLVSDEEFVVDPYPLDRTPPSHLRQFDETAAALNAKGIKQIGLSLALDGIGKATEDMQAMAAATDALAPAGGVDCDGDGLSDIAGGAPLVCEVSRGALGEGIGLASSIVNLVESIRTRSSVELEVDGPARVTEKVAPQRYESLVLQTNNRLDFGVTFRCPRSLAGDRIPVKLTATGLQSPVSVGATVVCGPLAAATKEQEEAEDEEEEELVPPFPFDRVLGLIPLVPLSPPPPLTELASSTQAQAQSQAQAQAQASVAAQRQEQPQLAFVHAVHAMRQRTQEEYAMSSFTPRHEMPTPALALGGAAVLMSLAFGLVMSRQRAGVRVRRAR